VQNIRNISIWKEKPQENIYQTALENADILELGLGVRAYNGLKRAGLCTVGQVMARLGEDGEGIKSIRNLGEKSQKEILEKLQELSLTYKAASSNISFTPSTAKKVLMAPNGHTWNREIASYNLSEATLSRLRDCGIVRVGDVYSPVLRQDPGWKAVRELFDRIISDAS